MKKLFNKSKNEKWKLGLVFGMFFGLMLGLVLQGYSPDVQFSPDENFVYRSIDVYDDGVIVSLEVLSRTKSIVIRETIPAGCSIENYSISGAYDLFDYNPDENTFLVISSIDYINSVVRYSLPADCIVSEGEFSADAQDWGEISLQGEDSERGVNLIDSCRELRTDNAKYKLTQDIVFEPYEIEPEFYEPWSGPRMSDSCFKITGNGITLDGNGYRITGSGDPYARTPYGVYLSGNNNTVKNLGVDNFEFGIESILNSGNIFLNNVFVANNYGLRSNAAQNSVVSGNQFSGNSKSLSISAGVLDSRYYLQQVSNNVVDGKNFYYYAELKNTEINSASAPNPESIYCAACENVTIKDLSLQDVHEESAIFILNSRNISVENVEINTLSSGGTSYLSGGINLFSVEEGLVRDSSVQNIYGHGVYIYGSNISLIGNSVTSCAIAVYTTSLKQGLIEGNQFSNNLFDGLQLNSGKNVLVRNNVFNNNSRWGAYLDSRSSNNLFEGNLACGNRNADFMSYSNTTSFISNTCGVAAGSAGCDSAC